MAFGTLPAGCASALSLVALSPAVAGIAVTAAAVAAAAAQLLSRFSRRRQVSHDAHRGTSECGAALKRSISARLRRAPVEFTVYLVRHGEAIHNIEEKKAKRSSIAFLEDFGVAQGEEAFQEIVEAARTAALSEESLKDAPLSEQGLNEAQYAHSTLEALFNEGFVPPDIVYVSPLQRALKTAAIAFPSHPQISVREELRERETGLPCDETSPARLLMRRETFETMSWNSLLRDMPDEQPSFQTARSFPTVESKTELRRRAREAMNKLFLDKHKSMAVVSHKGFLRELEGGLFGVPDSAEFQNCEIRVYTICRDGCGDVIATCRHQNRR